MTSASGQLVFVYGTLKRGGSNHEFLRGQDFRGEARTIPGFRLVDLGDYPGLLAYPDDHDGVTGEVWWVDNATLARLDELEGLNEGLYRRERIPLQPPFAHETVLSYFYAWSTTGRPHIPGGTWTARSV
ncbi:MAG TPA: gamma-glutamylcyclotransferase family protein [Opitutus sp.]|nr:gamma-glutamylcyclotransferase family protein [Opitutus sp.]